MISADIAIESGEINDNSIYTLLRMLPDSEGYKSEVVWMENHNGLSPEKQAMRLKELYEEFEADKIIMDTNGNGIAVFKEMQKSQYNDSLDKHYNSFILKLQYVLQCNFTCIVQCLLFDQNAI